MTTAAPQCSKWAATNGACVRHVAFYRYPSPLQPPCTPIHTLVHSMHSIQSSPTSRLTDTASPLVTHRGPTASANRVSCDGGDAPTYPSSLLRTSRALDSPAPSVDPTSGRQRIGRKRVEYFNVETAQNRAHSAIFPAAADGLVNALCMVVAEAGRH